MSETDEFAEALLAQLSVEINEEKEIDSLSKKIKEDNEFKVEFGDTEKIAQTLLPDLIQKANDYMGLSVSPDLSIVGLELEELKRFKGKKVFTTKAAQQFVDELFYAASKNDLEKISDSVKKDTTKFLVYSTYVIQYISKISITYGDFLDNTIYLNKFVLDNYPKIILYKQRPPYEPKFESVNSGYMGALKMTILEEIVHSVQNNLQRLNKAAVIRVNGINEELAKTIMELDDKTVSQLSEYLQLQSVPEEFVIAKRANLFFMLNPDNFITNVLGPDIMTYNKVDIDPKILEFIPSLLEIYQRWLKPIQDQHAVFTTMEGMAEFVVQNILTDDPDFQNYLSTFIGTDYAAYSVKKSIGKEFTEKIFETFGKDSFVKLETNPPNTRELKDPQLYLNRIK